MFLSFNAFAGNGELVPRKGLGPLDKAKVHEVQAQKWSRIGMGIEMENEAEDSVSQYEVILQVAALLEDVLKIVLQILEMLLLKRR